MAVTNSGWSVKTLNKRVVAVCRVSADTSDTDLPTPKFPPEIDLAKPFNVIINVSKDMTAASSGYMDVHGGYASDFSLTGGTSLTTVSGVEMFATTTDLDAGGVFSLRVIPGPTGVAQVTTMPGGLAVIPPMPYLALNYDSAALQDAAYVDFIVVQ